MQPTPDPPFESQPQGISLDELAQAFAQVMGVEPKRNAEKATADSGEATAEDAAAPIESNGDARPPAETVEEPEKEEDHCPISPRTILEAMLFVGNRENRPLSPAKAAELMRDVSVDEIPTLVDELNRRYTRMDAPYRVVGEGDGYRLSLCKEYNSLRNRFFGRMRETRLSQASLDVLALVAYQQPLTAEKLGEIRGKPSNHVLAQLVRRGLLRIERPDPKKRTPHYHTTERFLQLFNLRSLDDLPRSENAEPF